MVPPIIHHTTTANDINCAVSDERKINLSAPQLELLAWHYHLGHVGMYRIQRLVHQSKNIDCSDTHGVLCEPCGIATNHRSTNTCQSPKCAVYIVGQMERIPTSTTKSPGCQSGKLRRDDLLPDDGTPMYQFIVSVKGRILKNNSNDSTKYNDGIVYVDHSSQRIFNRNQIALRCGETLIGKHILEREAAASGFKLTFFI